MATDIRLKESLPALTERIVETYEECGGDQSPRPLPPAELPRGRRDPGRPPRDPLPGLRPPAEPAHGERRLPRRRPDRQPARPADPADRPRLPARLQGRSELETDFEAEAQLIAIRLLESIPDLRKVLTEDVQAAFDGDPAAKNLDEILFCYPGVCGDHRLPDRPRALQAGRPADPPDDDRVRPRQDRHRHPPRRDDRPPLLHRPRHRRRDRRDDPDRRRREDLPGRDPRRAQLPPRRERRRSSGTSSGTRRSRTRSSSTPTPRSSAARPSSATTPSSARRPGSPGASRPTPR